MSLDGTREDPSMSRPETIPEYGIDGVRSSVTLAVTVFGLFLVLVGGVLIPFGILRFGNASDVLAGMFGIWGGTFVLLGVGTYLVLRFNRWRSERTAFSVDE